MSRTATLTRTTTETAITLTLDLDGTGASTVATGVGFFDHMLTALARHALFDLTVEARGDLHIDSHHTIEDVGIVLGQAIRQALGDKAGIARFGHALVPMDEALAEAAVDMSGRAYVVWDAAFERPMLGTMDTQLVEEFFRALAGNALITLHVTRRAGSNAHHVAEACFKAVARALRAAVAVDARLAGAVPSTKGGAVKLFTTHTREGEPPVLVREGFSGAAFWFGALWLAGHRAWTAAGLTMAAALLALTLARLVGSAVPLVGLAVLQGLICPDLLRWSLGQRGFVDGPVVAAADEEQALLRVMGG